jgi:hypothetical protein
MSTPERTDDPGEHGHGGVKSNTPAKDDDESANIRDEPKPNPSRRTRDDEDTATDDSEQPTR